MAVPAVALALALGVAACGDKDDKDKNEADGGAVDAAGDDDAVADAAGGDAQADTAGGDGTGADAIEGDPAGQATILGIDETGTFTIPTLQGPAYVVRTEANVPHIYASSRADEMRVLGFVVAADRFFSIELGRRLGWGRVSELLGDAALETDIEARTNGMSEVARLTCEGMTEAHGKLYDAFAEGINAYIDAAKAGTMPLPSEIAIAGPLLGYPNPADMMTPFDREALCGFAAVVVYELGYETGDVGRAATAAKLPTLFKDGDGKDEPNGALRRQGVLEDIWGKIDPVKTSAGKESLGWGYHVAGELAAPVPEPLGDAKTDDAKTDDATTDDAKTDNPFAGDAPGSAFAPKATAHRVPLQMLERLATRLERFELMLGRDSEAGFGSNAWAVMGSKTKDGKTLHASDGHLPLTVPALFWQVGVDTATFGAEDALQQVGLMIAGIPYLAVGTNGQVMWGQTQLMGDITDWYREELQLGADGLPATSRFQGEDKAITTLEETFEIADVALLGSKGRTEKHQRFVTFDGRWIASIEGRDASGPDEALAEGEGLVRTADGWIVPGDVDGDGVVTAISFDYTGLDPSAMLRSLDRFGHAANVDEFREATKGLVAYSQSLVAADGDGNVLFAPYQTVPCRTYLARNEDGTWQDGANPSQLLDGTVYGGFTIALTDDGKVDESANATDPYRCVVPFDAYPMEKNHPQGYTVTANDDPAGLTFDSSLTNEPWYIGGPWLEGYRGDTIDWRVKDAIDAGEADVAKMAEIQADTTSRTGMDFAPFFIEAVERAQLLQTTDGPWTEADGRVVGLYEQRATELSAAATRLQAWLDDGAQTPAGVETFYHPTVTEQEKKDAVATMIFNAWLGRYISGVFDDEGLPGVWQPSGGTGRMRTLLRLLKGRGGDNPEQLASWLADTGESVFFDKRGTAPTETSFEIALMAMLDALAYLEGPPDAPDRGGFGTTDQSTWLWGLRHTVRFDSILLEFLDSAEQFAALADAFSITTTQLPLATPLPAGDPRKGLLGFPRPGDNYAVDAANSGLNGVSHHYGSGPVFRMVMALKDGAFEGVNILPGGQSALTDSDFFADQAAKWLGNETVPMRLTPEQVAAGATGRETFLPE